MSYDAILLIPLCALATVCGLLAIVRALQAPKPRLADRGFAALWALTVVGAQPVAAVGLSMANRGPDAHLSAHGWQAEHTAALQVWSQSETAASYLAYCWIPLILAGIALLIAAQGVRWGRWWLALVPVLALPLLLTVKATLPCTMNLWAPEDPRWSLGYAEQWLNEGAPSAAGALPCQLYLQTVQTLAEEEPSASLKQALQRLRERGADTACAKVCSAQDAKGYFNPGILEGLCFPER